MERLPPENIVETLKKALPFGGVIERPLVFSREKFEIKSISIENDQLIMTVDELITAHEDARHLVIQLNYRRLNFFLKNSDFTINGHLITAKIPSEAKAIYQRPTIRYQLDFENHPTIISRTERRGGQHEHQTYVQDISETGLALLMQKSEEGEELKAHDHLWIKSIGLKSLASPLFAKVVYTRIMEFNGKKYLKAGLRLEKTLEEELLNDIIKSSISTLVA